MKSGKRFFSELLFGIIYFAACNLIFWLIWLIINFLTSGIYNELYLRNGKDARAVIENIRNLLCFVLYLVTALLIYRANPVEKNKYVTKSYEREFSLLGEYASYLKERMLKSVVFYAVFMAPLFIVGLMFDYKVPFFPTAYIAQYSFAKLFAFAPLAYLMNIIVYAIWMFLFVPLVRAYWYGKRLR